MNAIVANKNEGLLNSLDIDVIKSINGEFTADEIIHTFSNFFFNRMFLDITAVKDYTDIKNIQKLSISLDIEKVIFLLDTNLMNDKTFLSKLISMGIYNFANTKESLLYLYNHPNSYKDVAHIHQLSTNQTEQTTQEEKKKIFQKNDQNEQTEKVETYQRNAKVIAFKNVTSGAGATSLIYMLKKYLSQKFYVVALEVNKNDFGYFNEKDMFSVNQSNLYAALDKFDSASYILVDLNNMKEDTFDDVIYLIEPSIIKLNKMMLINKEIFNKLYGKKIILNKSLLNQKDVTDFEYEAHTTIFLNIPPLNDREMNEEIFVELMDKLNGI